MTPDELEAKSRRYGTAPFMVLPLSSGNIAVIGHHRKLLGIATSWSEAKTIGENQPQFSECVSKPLRHSAPEPAVKLNLSLEDLGL